MVKKPAPVTGKAVAVNPDEVDVIGAVDDALLKQVRGLIDHGEQAPVEDFLIADCTRLDATVLAMSHEHPGHIRVRQAPALAFLVSIVTGCCFLSETPRLVQLFDPVATAFRSAQ